MDALFSLIFVAQVLRISVPYFLAALGGVYSERGGVIALCLEGELLVGAFFGVVGTELTGSPLVGVCAGAAAGVLVALLVAWLTIRLGADQIVTGVAVNLLAAATTRYLLKLIYDSSSNSPRIAGFLPPAWVSGMSKSLAPLAELLTNPLFIATLVLGLSAHAMLYWTPFGLRLRAVGEHPEAADTLGVAVGRMRTAGVLVGGALAGLGGVWLAFDQHQFVDQMSGLRGYIALAAVIFGKWTPRGAFFACLLFGFAESLQIALQSSRLAERAQLPTQLVQSIPYVLTLVTLAGVIGRSRAPAALGKPYLKG